MVFNLFRNRNENCHYDEYDRGDSFSFDFELNGIHFFLNRYKNCHYDHIAVNLKGNVNKFF